LRQAAYPADLEAAEQRQNVRVEPGDAVLLHTGLSAHRAENPGWDMNEHGSPGWDASCLPWLFQRQAAVIGTDGNNEALPNPHVDIWQHPIHAVGIRAMGLTLLNSCRMDQLAVTCKELNRWTFLLAVAPLVFRGATGSPVNPLVIF
jgi:kynurenine formamidase